MCGDKNGQHYIVWKKVKEKNVYIKFGKQLLKINLYVYLDVISLVILSSDSSYNNSCT